MSPKKYTISSIALVVKSGNQQAAKEAKKVAAWLKLQGLESISLVEKDETGKIEIPQVDFVLAFGGDGTIVSVARALLGRDIPLAGVNFGRVGFLAELSSTTWEQALSFVLKNGLVVEPRMTLAYTLRRNGKTLRQGQVINDIVVTRGKLARLVQLDLSVDQVPFSILRSDGIILSTPTGSTGYAGSAGGPVVLPSIKAYVVAAICPFLGSFPPLMLAAEAVFSIGVGESVTDLYLSIDGQEAYEICSGDVLEAYGGSDPFLLANMGVNSYFKRLQDVGIIQQVCKRT